MVNAGPYLGSALLGCWLSDPLNSKLLFIAVIQLLHSTGPSDYFGRRGTIFITALCLIATPIGSAFTKSWEALFAARYVPAMRCS